MLYGVIAYYFTKRVSVIHALKKALSPYEEPLGPHKRRGFRISRGWMFLLHLIILDSIFDVRMIQSNSQKKFERYFLIYFAKRILDALSTYERTLMLVEGSLFLSVIMKMSTKCS